MIEIKAIMAWANNVAKRNNLKIPIFDVLHKI